MTAAFVDNDILYKGTAYGCMAPLISAAPVEPTTVEVLKAAYFVVRKKLEKSPPARGQEVALHEFDDYFSSVDVIEPSMEELRVAAEVERLALEHDVALDVGESVLCAVLSGRDHGYLLTGDKRAIAATQTLMPTARALQKLQGRVICLEQLVFWLVAKDNVDGIRQAVCSESGVDIALTICFSCKSASQNCDACLEALSSYVRDVRSKAPDMLYPNP